MKSFPQKILYKMAPIAQISALVPFSSFIECKKSSGASANLEMALSFWNCMTTRFGILSSPLSFIKNRESAYKAKNPDKPTMCKLAHIEINSVIRIVSSNSNFNFFLGYLFSNFSSCSFFRLSFSFPSISDFISAKLSISPLLLFSFF